MFWLGLVQAFWPERRMGLGGWGEKRKRWRAETDLRFPRKSLLTLIFRQPSFTIKRVTLSVENRTFPKKELTINGYLEGFLYKKSSTICSPYNDQDNGIRFMIQRTIYEEHSVLISSNSKWYTNRSHDGVRVDTSRLVWIL